MSSGLEQLDSPDEAATAALQEIARRYGTPTYAFDVGRLRAQVERVGRR
ncbi:MAG: hypothetical protein IIA67_00475, partial [Planctomycetes bacterium]|nr:hypothetical protein [Planctomycetota bacterium]